MKPYLKRNLAITNSARLKHPSNLSQKLLEIINVFEHLLEYNQTNGIVHERQLGAESDDVRVGAVANLKVDQSRKSHLPAAYIKTNIVTRQAVHERLKLAANSSGAVLVGVNKFHKRVLDGVGRLLP